MEKISFKLEVFEGPLDLLLHLIEKNKINICDIPVALLLEQFMEYVEEYRRRDMEELSDFLVMAAHLLYIKSRMLLPRAEEEDEQDPRQTLAERLLEYKRYKDAAAELAERYANGSRCLAHPAEELEPDPIYRRIHAPEELAAAYRTVCRRSVRRMPPPLSSFNGIVDRKVVSVASKVAFVMRRLLKAGQVTFKSLFSGISGRGEIVATFLAVLELVKLRRINVEEQSDLDYGLSLAGRRDRVEK